MTGILLTSSFVELQPQAKAPQTQAPQKSLQTSAAVQAAQAAAQAKQAATAEPSKAELEQKRFEALQNTAQSLQSFYPTSHTRFTIYKDTSGQFVTRFTNMIDGSISYYPEPQLLKLYSQVVGRQQNLLKVDV